MKTKTTTTTTSRRSRIRRLIKGGVLAAGLLAAGPFAGEFADVPVVETKAQYRVHGENVITELWIFEVCWFNCPGAGFYCCGPVAM